MSALRWRAAFFVLSLEEVGGNGNQAFERTWEFGEKQKPHADGGAVIFWLCVVCGVMTSVLYRTLHFA